jgi:hypothetical protein
MFTRCFEPWDECGLLRLGFWERTNMALDVMPLNSENFQEFHRHYPSTFTLQLRFKPLFGIVIVLITVVVFAVVERSVDT